jgi:hypothetical protein
MQGVKLEAPDEQTHVQEGESRLLSLPPDLLRPIVLAVAMTGAGLSMCVLRALALACKPLQQAAEQHVEVLTCPKVTRCDPAGPVDLHRLEAMHELRHVKVEGDRAAWMQPNANSVSLAALPQLEVQHPGVPVSASQLPEARAQMQPLLSPGTGSHLYW